MFLTKGYDNTSIDDIIHEAQIAKGTYYYYFESKESTLEEVINMMINEEVELDKDKIIFVYCKSGNRSNQAHKILNNLGFNVYDLGGIDNIEIDIDLKKIE